MKTKLSLNKQTVDLLDSMNIYGGAGTGSGPSDCACLVATNGKDVCLIPKNTLEECTAVSYCGPCITQTEHQTCWAHCINEIHEAMSIKDCW